MSPNMLAEGKRRLELERTVIGSNAPPADRSPKATATPAARYLNPPRTQQTAPQAAPTAAAIQADDSALAPLQARIKDLQANVSSLTASNDQLSKQLDERSQALLQAVAQISSVKGLQDSQDGAKATELATARKDLEAANAALEDEKRQSAATIDSIQKDLAARTFVADQLKARVAEDEAALKAAGDSGASAKALGADLEKTRAALAAANSHLGEATKSADAERTAAASLKRELAQRSADSDSLAAKLAADETALKAEGDSGAKAQTLAAELTAAQAQLAADDAAAKKAKDAEVVWSASLEKELDDPGRRSRRGPCQARCRSDRRHQGEGGRGGLVRIPREGARRTHCLNPTDAGRTFGRRAAAQGRRRSRREVLRACEGSVPIKSRPRGGPCPARPVQEDRGRPQCAPRRGRSHAQGHGPGKRQDPEPG